jgi:hypothetical protein
MRTWAQTEINYFLKYSLADDADRLTRPGKGAWATLDHVNARRPSGEAPIFMDDLIAYGCEIVARRGAQAMRAQGGATKSAGIQNVPVQRAFDPHKTAIAVRASSPTIDRKKLDALHMEFPEITGASARFTEYRAAGWQPIPSIDDEIVAEVRRRPELAEHKVVLDYLNSGSLERAAAAAQRSVEAGAKEVRDQHSNQAYGDADFGWSHLVPRLSNEAAEAIATALREVAAAYTKKPFAEKYWGEHARGQLAAVEDVVLRIEGLADQPIDHATAESIRREIDAIKPDGMSKDGNRVLQMRWKLNEIASHLEKIALKER